MNEMEEHQYLPDTNRLSVLAATILLAYALTPFIQLPERSILLPIPGVSFRFTFSYITLVSFLVAGLAALGTDWLLRDHPRMEGKRTLQHCILPAMTAWVIGVPLRSLSIGGQWWVVFAFGGLLLVLVLVAEYITVDIEDERHALASIGLTAVSFALYLTLAIALRAAGLRLYLILPALVAAIGLAALRTLYLRLEGEWCLTWAVGIAMVIGQISMGLHYWPLSPLRFGLLLTGPAYALTSMAASFTEGRSWRTSWIEPAIMLAALWGLALGVQG